MRTTSPEPAPAPPEPGTPPGPGGPSAPAAVPVGVASLVRSDAARRVAAGLAAAAAMAVAVAAWRGSPPPPELSLPMAAPADQAAAPSASLPGDAALGGSGEAPTVDVVVHVSGAVARPGVYSLPEGARVADLLDAAGGAAADADLDRLNLALPLVDGARVHVPRPGEDLPEAAMTPVGGAAAGGAGEGGPTGLPARPIDLNRATEAELDALPGVGPATARAILDHRAKVGRFRSVDDLLDVPGIGETRLERLRPHVRV